MMWQSTLLIGNLMWKPCPVFRCLEEASRTLNLAKCEFTKATNIYRGKQVAQGQVRPIDAKITTIAEFPVPITKHELRQFLGLAGYYQGFAITFLPLCPF